MNAGTNQSQLLEEGQVVHGKWEILAFIARGGKGEVYHARQLNLDREVALKVMSKEFLDSLKGSEEEYTAELQRFRREVRVMARMRHPNVLQVYDFDQVEVNGELLDYIVMEYVPGFTLRQTMNDEGFGDDERTLAAWLRKYFLPVLVGMGAVHAQGVVHRDMKPENVLIDDNIPKIADFGLAGGRHLEHITRSHHVIGTLPYMPEEQFIDLAATDVRADVYALGKILYEAIEGRMTSERNKPFENVGLSRPATRMLRRLDKTVRNATAKDRSSRTPSVKVLREEIADILQEWEQNRDWIAARRRRRLIAAGGAMAAAALAIALLLGIHFYRAERQLRPADVERLREEQLVNLRTILKHPSAHPEFDIAVRPTNVPEPPPGADPPSKISGSDGMTLRFVPGGKAHVAVDQVETPDREQTEKTVRVAPFYMDETKITNHLYVEFLREVSGVRVQGNAVINDGQIWLLLGEIREGYEPIKYVDGEFRIQSDAVSRPVVRVTPLGALAYARHYGRTLPTMAQWWRAIQAGGTGAPPDEAESAPDSGMMHEHMMQDHMMRNGEANQPGPEETNGILPVTRTGGNRLGIRGLAQNVNEWVFGTPEEDVLTFHVHGGVGELESLSSYFERHPWEAFARVGFRTVIEAPAGEGGS